MSERLTPTEQRARQRATPRQQACAHAHTHGNTLPPVRRWRIGRFTFGPWLPGLTRAWCTRCGLLVRDRVVIR